MKVLKTMTLLVIISICSFSQGDAIKLEESTIILESELDTPSISEKSSTMILFKEQIDNGDYKDLEGVLREVPNIIVQNTYFGPRVDIRGNGEKSISRVKVLVNGISINPIDDTMGTLPINSIPLNSIEKIEITPGGGTVLNGSGSSGGVINVITKASLKKDFVTLEGGVKSYDFRDTGISLGQNLTEDIYGNFNYSYLNGNGYRDGDSQESNSFNGGVDYTLNSKNRVKFQINYFEENRDYSTGITKEELQKNRKTMGFPIESSSKRESYVLDYEYKYSDSLKFLSSFYYQKYKRDFTEKSIMDYEIPKVPGMPLEIVGRDLYSEMNGEFKERSNGLKLKSIYTYEMGEAILGYDYNYTKLLRDSDITAKGDFFPKRMPSVKIKGDVSVNLKNNIFKETNGVYGINRYNLSDKLELILGARYEHSRFGGKRTSETEILSMSRIYEFKESENEEKSDNYALEVGTNYKYSDLGTFYTSYERGFTSPLPGQITDKINMRYFSNDLKSETSDNFEIGVKDFVGNTLINLSLFAVYTHDEIVLIQKNSYNPAIKEWQYKNLNQVRKLGSELYLEQYFDRATLYQSFSYVNTKITKGLYSGEEVPMVPQGKIVLGGSYEVNSRLKTNINFNLIGSYKVKEYGVDDEVLNKKVSSYNYTDIIFTYKVTEFLNISLGANNIFNQKYNYEEGITNMVPAPGVNYFISGKMEI